MKILDSRQKFGSHLGLERISLICRELGDPQKRVKAVHVAGTNGKGSTSSFIASILQEAGLKVALYTSPHLVDYRERFAINGSLIPKEDLERVLAKVEQAIEVVEKAHPEFGAVTEFEVATAAAFLYFAEEKVDIAVIETGLGGRLDATNVIVPEVSVITPISFDHVEWLGDSLSSIAAEKAGIIKPGVPVVIGYQQDEAEKTLITIATEKNSKVVSLADSGFQVVDYGFNGGSFKLTEISSDIFQIHILGLHQLENAATALLAATVLKESGWKISDQAIFHGLKKARWAARLEVVSPEKPWILLDAAHNEAGIKVLAKSLTELFKGQPTKLTFVIGMTENKEPSLLDPLLPLAKRMIFVKASSGRLPGKQPDELKNYVMAKGIAAEAYSDLAEGIKQAYTDEYVCICGSIYLLGEIIPILT